MNIESTSKNITPSIFPPANQPEKTIISEDIKVKSSPQQPNSFQDLATVALPYKVTNDYNVLRMPAGSSLLQALGEAQKQVSQYVEARSTKGLETSVVYCFDFDDVLAESHYNGIDFDLHIQGAKNAQDAEDLVAATAKMFIKTVKDSSYNCIITSRLGE